MKEVCCFDVWQKEDAGLGTLHICDSVAVASSVGGWLRLLTHARSVAWLVAEVVVCCWLCVLQLMMAASWFRRLMHTGFNAASARR